MIFQSTPTLPQGPIPIIAVDRHCRIMVQNSQNYLYLSISYPDLNFHVSKVLQTSEDIGARVRYDLESQEIQVQVTSATNVEMILPTTPKTHRSPIDYIPSISVQPSSLVSSPPEKGNKIVFDNLRNGFSVEIKLTK